MTAFDKYTEIMDEKAVQMWEQAKRFDDFLFRKQEKIESNRSFVKMSKKKPTPIKKTPARNWVTGMTQEEYEQEQRRWMEILWGVTMQPRAKYEKV